MKLSRLFLLSTLLALPLAARAQTPAIQNIISYQGLLSNANGTPVADGTQRVKFSIEEIGGAISPLFSTTQDVQTVGGVFNALLTVGTNPLNPGIFDPAKSYTLTVTFNGTSTTQPISAVPVAKSAQTAATANNVSGVVAVANGGTGSATKNFVDLSSTQTVAGAKTFASALSAQSLNANSITTTGQVTAGAVSAATLNATNTVNANGGYNIGSQRVLSVSGTLGVAVGEGAGGDNTAGVGNAFFGANAGQRTTGDYNVFVGRDSGLNNTTGARNIFVGQGAGFSNSTGSNNIAVGLAAGSSLTTGDYNIAIGSDGVAGESKAIRIGQQGRQTTTYIAGIRDRAVLNALPVYVDANGQLGTLNFNTSSRRFKQEIAPLGHASDYLLRLRPVSFRYTAAYQKSDAPSEVKYGLIAEEVAQVAPQMAHFGADGQADGVSYADLPIMLLNLVQQQQRTIDGLRTDVAALRGAPQEPSPRDQLEERDAQIAALRAQLQTQNAAFEARLQKLESSRANPLLPALR